MNNNLNEENKNEQPKKRYVGVEFNNKFCYYSLAALILSIIGIIITALPFTGPFFGIPVAVVSIVLSIVGTKSWKWHTLNTYSVVINVLNFILGTILIFVF